MTVDARGTKSAVSLLGTVIGQLMEDGSVSAIAAAKLEPLALAAELRAIGADIVVLAGAIEVLARRAET